MLVRRISPNKWKDWTTDESGQIDLGADAITGCLRTNKNTLSVWKVDNISEEVLDDAILALITGTNQEKLSKIDFVIIDEKELEDNGFELINTEGDTAVDDLIGKHYDIIDVTYNKLGVVKDIILRNINPKNQRSLKQIQSILSKALQNERVKIEKLKAKFIDKEMTLFHPYVVRQETSKIVSSYSEKKVSSAETIST